MRGKKWFILLASLALVLLASSVGVTRSSFVDLEGSTGNTFQAWTSRQWTQTTEDDFNAGVLYQTVDVQVGADADDGEEDGREYGTNSWKTDGYYEGENEGFIGYYETFDSPFEPGFRFDNITCSGTITNAYIELYFISEGHLGSPENPLTTTGAYLYGIDEADPATFSEADNTTWPSSRNRTTANVSWNKGYCSGWHQSPDISTIIQELVDKYTYTGTQAMSIYWREDTHTQGTYAMFELYGHDGSHTPRLHIEYTTVDTATSPGDVKLAVVSDWYDTSWTRRAPITISNTGSGLTDYQVKVDVTYDADMQPDFDDIRFVDSDGSTLLSHWRESYIASTSATFWVKVPSIPSGAKTIYMYYGNASASSATSGDATFIFFDDFEEHASGEDPDGWTDQGIDNFYVALHDSEKWFQVEGWDDWTKGSTASSMANIGDAVWSARIYYWQEGTNAWGGIGVHIDNGGVGYIVIIRDGGWYRADEAWGNASGWQSNTDIHFPLDTKGRIELITNGTNLDAYWYNPAGYSPEKVTVFTGFTMPSGTGKLDVHIERPGGGNTRWVDADDIIVRKYASPEPTTSVGSEQGMYVSSGAIASQVLDTGVDGARWDGLFWDEILESGTDITFEVRASDTLSGGFPDTSWVPVGGTSPVTSGLPSGRYLQWRATLTTSDTSNTPTLQEVRVYHY